MEFHSEVFFKLVSSLYFPIKLNDNYFTDIENLHLFEKENRYLTLLIIKIPVKIPIVKVNTTKYTAESFHIEKQMKYNDFLKDDTLFTDLKKGMKRVDIRMGFQQTEEICMKAIENDPFFVKFVKKDFDTDFLNEIYLKAVKKEGSVVEYIPPTFISKEIWLEAVKQDGINIQYIWIDKDYRLNIDRDIVLAAVKSNAFAIKYIPDENLDKELCLEAVKNCGIVIENIPESLLDKELCLEAVKNDGNAIIGVPLSFLDKKICLEAVKLDEESLEYIVNSKLFKKKIS